MVRKKLKTRRMKMYRNLDPIDAYDAYSADEYLAQQKRQVIADEMYNYKIDALEIIDKVVHPAHANLFAKVLTTACTEECEHAEKLAQNMGLNQEHLIALRGDEKEFSDHLDRKEFGRRSYFYW